jgi:GAF domain-containing protein/HAMP domain-containing protein
MKTRTKKPSTSRSLSVTLAIAFLALSAVVLILSSGLQLFSNIATQQEAVAGKLQLTAQEASQTVRGFILDKSSVLGTAIQLTDLATASATERQRVLDSLLGRDPAFRQIATLDAQGQETGKSSRLSQQASSNLAEQIPAEALAQIAQGKPYISPIYVDPLTSEPLVLMAIPETNALGDFQGTLAAEVNLKFMWDLVDQLKVGDNGVAFVVDKQGNLIAFNDTSRVLRGENVANLGEVRKFVGNTAVPGTTVVELSTGIKGTQTVGSFAPLGTPDWAVVVELPWEEAYREVIRNSFASGVILVVMAVLAGLLGVYVARRLTVPLVSLTDTASQIGSGDLELQASVSGPREVAQLATSFNTMTLRLRDTIDSLETRVEMRTDQLRASADVGRAAASVLEPDELLRRVVNLISDRFGFYYAAVFIVDRSGQYAVLREATGEAGRILKERGHQLEVNGQSMVGYAITRRRPRIALDVGEDAMRFANPLLPDTRSEIALPLIVGDRVLGVLDVQSTQEAAFDEASAAVLQSMADQIAIAWNNALSYTGAQTAARHSRALFAASREVGRLQTDLSETIRATLRAAADTLDYDPWCVMTFNEIRTELISVATHNWPDADEALNVQALPDHPLVLSAEQDVELFVSEASDPRLGNLNVTGLHGLICVPIKTRDVIVGVLAFGRTYGAELTDGDLDIGRSLTSLVAIAIENYNLVETSQRTLSELDEINRSLTGQSWDRFVRRQDQRELIWVSQNDHMQPQQLPEVREALTQGHIATRALQDAQQLGVAVPIKLRDVPVGALRLIVPKRTWNPEMAAMLDSIAGHVAQAAENARLIAETEQRFTRERALTEATEKVRQRGEIEAILQTAATELARYLNASHIAVRLSPERGPVDGNGQ